MTIPRYELEDSFLFTYGSFFRPLYVAVFKNGAVITSSVFDEERLKLG